MEPTRARAILKSLADGRDPDMVFTLTNDEAPNPLREGIGDSQ